MSVGGALHEDRRAIDTRDDQAQRVGVAARHGPPGVQTLSEAIRDGFRQRRDGVAAMAKAAPTPSTREIVTGEARA